MARQTSKKIPKRVVAITQALSARLSSSTSSTSASVTTRSIHRKPLNGDELLTLANTMKEQFGWAEEPCPFQVMGVRAQLEGQDMIIQARAGSGKTAVVAGPHMSP